MRTIFNIVHVLYLILWALLFSYNCNKLYDCFLTSNWSDLYLYVFGTICGLMLIPTVLSINLLEKIDDDN